MSPLSNKDQQRLYGYEPQSRGHRKFTDDQISSALTDAHAAKGGRLTREAYQAYYKAQPPGTVPHPYTVIRRHGKWSDAMKAAGLPTNARNRYSNRVSKEECLDGIREARKILGHLPSVAEYSKLWHEGDENHNPLRDSGYPAEGTIRLRYNRWKSALYEVGKDRDPF